MADAKTLIDVSVSSTNPFAESICTKGDKQKVLQASRDSKLYELRNSFLEAMEVSESDWNDFVLVAEINKSLLKLDLSDPLNIFVTQSDLPIFYCYDSGNNKKENSCLSEESKAPLHSACLMEGWLCKKGKKKMSKYRRRYFRVFDNYDMTYYKSERQGDIAGSLSLKDCFDIKATTGTTFELSFEKRTFWLKGENDQIVSTWIDFFEKVRDKLHKDVPFGGIVETLCGNPSISRNSFENKLTNSRKTSAPGEHSKVYKEGFLEKRGGKNENWRRRYVRIFSYSIRYYRTKKDKKHAGEIQLGENSFIQPVYDCNQCALSNPDRCISMQVDDNARSFALVNDGRRYIFHSLEKSCMDWVICLNDRISELYPESTKEVTIQSGFVHLKEKKSWKKRMFVLTSENLSVYKTKESRTPLFSPKISDIRVFYGYPKTRKEASLEVSISNTKMSFYLLFDCETNFLEWIASFEIATGKGIGYESELTTEFNDPESIMDELENDEIVARALDCSAYELSLSCTGLVDMDIFSRSDPQAYLYVDDEFGEFHMISNTEFVMDNLNPHFVHKFIIHDAARFSSFKQNFLLKLYDIDDFCNPQNLENQDFLGELKFTLNDLLNAQNNRMVASLSNEPVAKKFILGKMGKKLKTQKGIVTIYYEEMTFDNKVLSFNIRFPSLKGKSVFLIINRFREDGTAIPVLRTTQSKTPVWNSVFSSFQRICFCSPEWPIEIVLYEASRCGRHKILGRKRTNLKEIQDAEKNTIQLKGEKNLEAQIRMEMIVMPTFLEYLDQGLKIYNTVIVDFGSRGNLLSSNPKSNHFLSKSSGECSNIYTKAISSVLRVLERFSADESYAIYGVGATPTGGSEDDDFFPLTGRLEAPCVLGIDDLVAIYKEMLEEKKIIQNEEFKLSPVLNHIKNTMLEPPPGPCYSYHVITIFLAGKISDFIGTLKSIVDITPLPCSIVLIGLNPQSIDGEGEKASPVLTEEQEQEYFAKCIDLDSDFVRLHAGEEFAARDIVQYFFYNRIGYFDIGLAKGIFEEIPYQIIEYISMKGEENENNDIQYDRVGEDEVSRPETVME